MAVVVNGIKLLPELYFVPQEYVEREKKQPHSMPRHPNENVPLIWAQSLWYLGRMIDEGLLAAGEIDPLGRSLHYYNMEPRVQVLLPAISLCSSVRLFFSETVKPSDLLAGQGQRTARAALQVWNLNPSS